MFNKHFSKMYETSMNTKKCHLVEEMKHDSTAQQVRYS